MTCFVAAGFGRVFFIDKGVFSFADFEVEVVVIARGRGAVEVKDTFAAGAVCFF